jgi:hypothetical protein
MRAGRLLMLIEVDFDQDDCTHEEMRHQLEERLDELDDCNALTLAQLPDDLPRVPLVCPNPGARWVEMAVRGMRR